MAVISNQIAIMIIAAIEHIAQKERRAVDEGDNDMTQGVHNRIE